MTPSNTQEQAILQIRGARETEIENERQIMGKMKFLQKALKKLHAQLKMKTAIFFPLNWNTNTVKRK